jgi:hypothetical protein
MVGSVRWPKSLTRRELIDPNCRNVRFGLLAIMASQRDVRFTPESGRQPLVFPYPLCANSGRGSFREFDVV